MIRRSEPPPRNAIASASPARRLLPSPARTPVLARNLALNTALLCLIAAAAAQAAPRRAPGYAYITVESRYGAATVTAAVRRGPAGRLEVRLPGGTWIECRQNCHDTLRRETVDFWQERGRPRAGGDGPGYLHFEF